MMEINDPFEYRAPNQRQIVNMQAVAASLATTYWTIMHGCPDSAEKTLAIRSLQEARMWANAAISFAGEPVITRKADLP